MEKINVDKFKRLPWSEKNTLLEGFLLTGKYEDALECLPTELKCFIFEKLPHEALLTHLLFAQVLALGGAENLAIEVAELMMSEAQKREMEAELLLKMSQHYFELLTFVEKYELISQEASKDLGKKDAEIEFLYSWEKAFARLMLQEQSFEQFSSELSHFNQFEFRKESLSSLFKLQKSLAFIKYSLPLEQAVLKDLEDVILASSGFNRLLAKIYKVTGYKNLGQNQDAHEILNSLQKELPFCLPRVNLFTLEGLNAFQDEDAGFSKEVLLKLKAKGVRAGLTSVPTEKSVWCIERDQISLKSYFDVDFRSPILDLKGGILQVSGEELEILTPMRITLLSSLISSASIGISLVELTDIVFKDEKLSFKVLTKRIQTGIALLMRKGFPIRREGKRYYYDFDKNPYVIIYPCGLQFTSSWNYIKEWLEQGQIRKDFTILGNYQICLEGI